MMIWIIYQKNYQKKTPGYNQLKQNIEDKSNNSYFKPYRALSML